MSASTSRYCYWSLFLTMIFTISLHVIYTLSLYLISQNEMTMNLLCKSSKVKVQPLGSLETLVFYLRIWAGHRASRPITSSFNSWHRLKHHGLASWTSPCAQRLRRDSNWQAAVSICTWFWWDKRRTIICNATWPHEHISAPSEVGIMDRKAHPAGEP
jgi:hypothetical protein